MSRGRDWNNTYCGIINYLAKNGIKDKEVMKKSRKLVYAYTKEGSFSERVLIIREDFNTFKKFMKSKIKTNEIQN